MSKLILFKNPTFKKVKDNQTFKADDYHSVSMDANLSSYYEAAETLGIGTLFQYMLPRLPEITSGTTLSSDETEQYIKRLLPPAHCLEEMNKNLLIAYLKEKEDALHQLCPGQCEDQLIQYGDLHCMIGLLIWLEENWREGYYCYLAAS